MDFELPATKEELQDLLREIDDYYRNYKGEYEEKPLEEPVLQKLSFTPSSEESVRRAVEAEFGEKTDAEAAEKTAEYEALCQNTTISPPPKIRKRKSGWRTRPPRTKKNSKSWRQTRRNGGSPVRALTSACGRRWKRSTRAKRRRSGGRRGKGRRDTCASGIFTASAPISSRRRSK